MKTLKIQAIVDNELRNGTEGLATEAGLSYWIEYKDRVFLFDAGEGDAIRVNLPKLNRSLKDVDGVIISHGHHDHLGGMDWVLEGMESNVPIYAKASVTDPIWSNRASGMAYAGVKADLIEPIQARLHAIDAVEEIEPGFFLVPQASNRYPQPGSSQFLFEGEEGALRLDTFAHECFIVIRMEAGLVVISGCSHQGIANMVDRAKELFPGEPVLSVIGGFHLQGRKPDFEESQETIQAVADYLKDQVAGTVYTGHCTSMPGFEGLKEVMGDQVKYFYTGDILAF